MAVGAEMMRSVCYLVAVVKKDDPTGKPEDGGFKSFMLCIVLRYGFVGAVVQNGEGVAPKGCVEECPRVHGKITPRYHS
jgi:hypothetical protein